MCSIAHFVSAWNGTEIVHNCQGVFQQEEEKVLLNCYIAYECPHFLDAIFIFSIKKPLVPRGFIGTDWYARCGGSKLCSLTLRLLFTALLAGLGCLGRIHRFGGNGAAAHGALHRNLLTGIFVEIGRVAFQRVHLLAHNQGVV